MNYRIKLLFLSILLVICGCWGAIVIHPVGLDKQETINQDSIIKENLSAIGNFSEKLSVNLINIQIDKSNHTYLETMGTYFQVNYNEFTGYFIDGLSKELTKRGAVVSADSPNKIHIKLSDFRMSYKTTIGRIYFLIHVSSEDKKWEKTYNGSGTRNAGGSILLSSVVYQNIRTLLEDSEFLKQLKI
ncbi:MAG: YajG family lipoprotein [Proteobacteria bacterium]|nr:YajG family lipoprotein [Pseudomonadota bacterium]